MSRLQPYLRVQMVTQEPFQWVEGFKNILQGYDLTVNSNINLKLPTDIYLLMWANQEAKEFINRYRGDAKIILWVRRYEYYQSWLYEINFNKVSAVIFVNDYLAEGFEKQTGVKTHVIYNSVDLNKWTLVEKLKSKNIGMVGWINQKKNFPLAIQILSKLPKHELHIAGGVQDSATMDYIFNLAADLKITLERLNFHGRIPHHKMDAWLNNIGVLLSCSISEGCPNNVLEAMAKGIPTIIHNWPGAKDIFPEECIFNTVDEACELITTYGTTRKLFALDDFGIGNYERIADIIQQITGNQKEAA